MGLASPGRATPSAVELRHAFGHGELAAWYQPTMGLADGVVNGLEALARWHHPRLGLLPAAAFVPLAEECGLVHVLDEWMWHEVFRQLARWQDDVVVTPGFRVGLNISAVEFASPQFAGRLVRAIDHAGVNPRGLTLELSQARLRHDPSDSRRAGDELHELGVDLALTDLGIGCRPADLVGSLPFDLLKLDLAVIDRPGATAGRAAVGPFVALAVKRHAKVLAEGIETTAEADDVRRLGCHDGQGFLWMAAVSADAAEALLTMRTEAGG